MTIDPRTPDEIYNSLRSSLEGKIVKLTNFVTNSFNDTWLSAYSSQVHEVEARVLVAQLSAWPDYAGSSSLTQTDLDRLGVDGVDPSELNRLMEGNQLDELAKIVGAERDPGTKATGKVTVETATDDTRVPEGMEVATEPDVDGNYLSYFVDADGDGTIEDDSSIYVTPDTGTTQVTVDVIAGTVGSNFNVGPGSITQLPSPPVGVEGVSNTNAIDGGDDRQTTEEFREDVNQAVFKTSGGGTAAGVEGYIQDNVTGVADVEVDEFAKQQPPFVDVIVDGGTETAVRDAIDASRPVGIKHNLVRPEDVSIGFRVEVVGDDVDTSFLRNQLLDHLADLGIGERLVRSDVINTIHAVDNHVNNVGSLTTKTIDIGGELHVFESGTSIYRLDFAPLGIVEGETRLFDSDKNVYGTAYPGVDATTAELIATVSGDETTLVEGTDYSVVDSDSDGSNDAVDFSIGGSNPDDRTTYELEYDHSSWSIPSVIEDENGNTYDKGVDWDLIDNDSDGRQDSIDWSIGGDSPSDGVRWTIEYSPKRIVPNDLPLDIRERIAPNDPGTSVTSFSSE